MSDVRSFLQHLQIDLVVAHALAQSCLAVYLHAIDYNAPAIAFYQRQGFAEVSLVHNFYRIGCVVGKRNTLPTV